MSRWSLNRKRFQLWREVCNQMFGHTDFRRLLLGDIHRIENEVTIRLAEVRSQYAVRAATNRLVRYADIMMCGGGSMGTFNLSYLTDEGRRVWELMYDFAGKFPRFRNVHAKGFTVRYVLKDEEQYQRLLVFGDKLMDDGYQVEFERREGTLSRRMTAEERNHSSGPYDRTSGTVNYLTIKIGS